MSKNPYEIRLETLRMAKEMLDRSFDMKYDLMREMIEQAKETNQPIQHAYDKYVPDMFKPEEIIKKADELYSYISAKKQVYISSILWYNKYMKSFYTSVNRYGNSILYRGYNESGVAVSHKYKFSPTLFIPSKDPSEWTSFDGTDITPMNFDTMREAKEFLEQYKDMDNLKLYGTTNYIHQFITDKFPSEVTFNPNSINVVNFDIEV